MLLRLDDDEQICSEGADHRVVQWRNVMFTHWFAPVSVSGLEACETASFELAARYPAGVVVFNLIEFGLQIPEPAARKKASEALASTSAHVRVTTTVVPGEGFWVSAARAAVATITLLSRAGHPHRVFSKTDDAARFVLPFVVPEPTPLHHIQRALSRLAELHQG
ncbi:MAG: hypothetical protein KUG77_10820 [Nannocystaceae bacterium]|nr:hypothetical protein [Nannocystaceae bacterium]